MRILADMRGLWLRDTLKMLSKAPYFLRKRVLANFIKMMPESIEPNNFSRKLKRFIMMAEEPYRIRHYNWISIFRDFEKDHLFSDSFKKEYASKRSFYYLDKVFDECGSKDILDQVMYTDIRTNLLDDLIVKMDIATMANSLEGRSPFLDHKMLEFCAAMPTNLKIKGMRLKYIIKKALHRKLPDEILKRKKMGFGIPVDKWFRVDLKDYAYDILMSDKSINRGYFKKDSIKKLLGEHVAGKANNGARIWSLLFLELWHRMFVDGENI